MVVPPALRRGLATLPQFADSLSRVVTPATAASLQSRGWALVDGVFGDSTAEALRAEVLALHSAGHTKPNATLLVKDGVTQRLEKRGIHEAEMHTLSASGAATAPLLSQLAKDRSLITLLTVYLSSAALRQDTLVGQVLKAQVNSGAGACFPTHCDSEETLDSRRVTALFYLNPGWQAGQGGELVLYPAEPESLGSRVVVAPRADRLVLFASHRMLHRVLPSAVQRCMFTLWLFARNASPKPATPVLGASDDVLPALLSPALRAATMRTVWRREWADSIAEAHPPSAARDAALATFQAEEATALAELLRRVPGAAGVLDAARERAERERVPEAV